MPIKGSCHIGTIELSSMLMDVIFLIDDVYLPTKCSLKFPELNFIPVSYNNIIINYYLPFQIPMGYSSSAQPLP